VTRQEALAVLAILKTAYPTFYKNYSKEDINSAVDLWATMFADDPAHIVTEAVKSLICTLKYPPTIADVKEKNCYDNAVTDANNDGDGSLATCKSGYKLLQCR